MFVGHIEWLSAIYEDNTEYKSFCRAGTGHREKGCHLLGWCPFL